MHEAYYNENKEMIKLLEDIDITDTCTVENITEYLLWQKERHIIFSTEHKPLFIPQCIFANKISSFEFKKHEHILNKYYYSHNDFYIKKNVSIINPDALYLLKNMVLIAGKVVWIKFGYNIGREFRGLHPGVILKHIGECYIVAPLTSGVKDPEIDRQIDVSKIYKFKLRDSYTDISRILPVSIYRIDLNNRIGNIHKDKLNEIKSGIINYWQNLFRIYN